MKVTFDNVANYLEKTHKRVSIILKYRDKYNQQSVLLNHDLPVKLIALRAVKMLGGSSDGGTYTLTDGTGKFDLYTPIGEIEADTLMVVRLEAEGEELEFPEIKPETIDDPQPESIEDTEATDTTETSSVQLKQEPTKPTRAEVYGSSASSQLEHTLNEANVTPADDMRGTMVERRGKLELVDVISNRRYPINDFPAIIGRKEGNENADMVAIDLSGSSKVSRNHVQITEHDRGFEVMNLSTTNTLVLNDDEIKVAMIQPDDILIVGGVELRIYIT